MFLKMDLGPPFRFFKGATVDPFWETWLVFQVFLVFFFHFFFRGGGGSRESERKPVGCPMLDKRGDLKATRCMGSTRA